MKHSIAEIVSIYNELKADNDGKSLKVREFIKRSGVTRRELDSEFGASAYSKLQKLAGNKPNRLVMKRTPTEEIMRNYGDLAMEVLQTEGRLPVSAHWKEKDLHPTESGLKVSHGFKWSEFPMRFSEFCDSNESFRKKYIRVLSVIAEGKEVEIPDNMRSNPLFEKICSKLRTWSPAMRRSGEEAYKSELSRHLRQMKFLITKGLNVREEKSESLCDIGVGSNIGIEVKKSPSLSEYDRCFGQIARHLKLFNFIAVIVFDVPRQDQFEDFCELVDSYYGNSVRVIKNG
jgi:hypothetical protein